MTTVPPRDDLRTVGKHWLKFNVVGFIGMIVQTVVMVCLDAGLGLRSSLAFALAVEAAVIHNFLWHEKWTWSDRPAGGFKDRLTRFLGFNLSNGVVSLLGAVAFTEILHERLHIPMKFVYFISILACSLINFFLSDFFVFRKRASSVPPSLP